MQYMGGKSKISKPLAAYLHTRLRGRYFVEPFCGALNVTAAVGVPCTAADASPYLFTLYRALRAGWLPPEQVSEGEYHTLQTAKDPENPMTAFAGYGCSFAAKFFGGYARDGAGSNYAARARSSLLRKFAALHPDTTFACVSYDRLSDPVGCLVYCDPPYAQTTGYAAVGAFNNEAFWQRMREWSLAGVTVLVSEYKAPPDWRSVWSTQHTASVSSATHGGTRLTEHLFEYAP